MKYWARTIIPAAIFGVVLSGTSIGCHRASETTVAASSEAQGASGKTNLLVADVSGDASLHVEAKGDDVQVGFLPTAVKGQGQFSISGSELQGAERVEVNPGISGGFHFTPGVAQDAGGGRLSRTQDDGNGGDQDKVYNAFKYMLYFNTDPGTPNLGHITLTKADKVASTNARLVRYHLAGTFEYVAATAPETPSAACFQEALAYVAAHGERHPQYNAAVCEAKRVTVNGRFDVTQDFPAAAF